MKILSTYFIKIKDTHGTFENTVALYRKAVDFFIEVALAKWDCLSDIEYANLRQRTLETYCVATKKIPQPECNFSMEFPKFPSYLRRAAITEAIGKASSYKSNYDNWKAMPAAFRGKEPGIPVAGHVSPTMYRDNMFVHTGTYTARIKV